MKRIEYHLFLAIILAVGFIVWFASLGFNITDPFVGLSQIAGIFAFTIISSNLFLAARFKFTNKIFWGLEKLYPVHHQFGLIALIVLLTHPLFFYASLVPNYNVILTSLLPKTVSPYTYGEIALLLFVLSLVLIYMIKVPRRIWLYFHRLLSVSFVIAIVHIFTVKNYGIGLYIYLMAISIIGIVSIFYIAYNNYRIRKASLKAKTSKI